MTIGNVSSAPLSSREPRVPSAESTTHHKNKQLPVRKHRDIRGASAVSAPPNGVHPSTSAIRYDRKLVSDVYTQGTGRMFHRSQARGRHRVGRSGDGQCDETTVAENTREGDKVRRGRPVRRCGGVRDGQVWNGRVECEALRINIRVRERPGAAGSMMALQPWPARLPMLPLASLLYFVHWHCPHGRTTRSRYPRSITRKFSLENKPLCASRHSRPRDEALGGGGCTNVIQLRAVDMYALIRWLTLNPSIRLVEQYYNGAITLVAMQRLPQPESARGSSPEPIHTGQFSTAFTTFPPVCKSVGPESHADPEMGDDICDDNSRVSGLMPMSLQVCYWQYPF